MWQINDWDNWCLARLKRIYDMIKRTSCTGWKKKLQKWETTRQLGCIHTGSNWEMGLTLFSRNETMLQTFFFTSGWWTSPEINSWHPSIYVEDPAARCAWRCGLVVGWIHLVSQFASKKNMLTGLFSREKNVKFHPPKMFLIVFNWTYNDAFPKSSANMIFKIITNTWIKDSFQTHFSKFKILFRNDQDLTTSESPDPFWWDLCRKSLGKLVRRMWTSVASSRISSSWLSIFGKGWLHRCGNRYTAWIVNRIYIFYTIRTENNKHTIYYT